MYSYTNHGNGDITVTVSVPATGCFGFWMTKSDPGFNATYALLLAAYHSKATVRTGGDDAQPWSGSGSNYCRMTFAAAL